MPILIKILLTCLAFIAEAAMIIMIFYLPKIVWDSWIH